MVDAPPDPDSDGEAGGGPAASAPLWVKVFGVFAIVLAMLFAVLHLAFGGLMRHTP